MKPWVIIIFRSRVLVDQYFASSSLYVHLSAAPAIRMPPKFPRATTCRCRFPCLQMMMKMIPAWPPANVAMATPMSMLLLSLLLDMH
ncbi:hypothetical protein BCR44DRAFT_233682 [Catenaria anguillulae PL171]|uniref:Uncharacterized protein n=1 Tax=Catenaria anguillulae PL171 TaxID=765915 RepID=A0A1Y2H0H5_9FUNG|nr:hypothetical protein BCR44DRAFT_233682 [Catenaria anguillulae PL171]